MNYKGQTITHVRSATGVSMKGADVDEDSRLVNLLFSFLAFSY